jgi:benzoyl-CoA reductase/2-hydroxyglutaryl-CoA dehydratase subunit BcrC/BadD/HgdB
MTTPFKKLESTVKLKSLLTTYYRDLDNTWRSGGKVAWCSSIGPAELLISFGYKVYYPENHGAMLGASKTSTNYIPAANAMGYSPDICSYLTSDIGAFLKNETPLRAYNIECIPRPSVLVTNDNQCKEVCEWFRFYAKIFKVPFLQINTPRNLSLPAEHQIEYVERELKELADKLEKIADTKFDYDNFRNTIAKSLEASNLWKDILELCKYKPSPLTFFDCCIQMAPAVILRGTDAAPEYYKILKNEVQMRIENSIPAVDDEKFRLYWDGMPIWGKLKDLASFFRSLKACIVASTYCNSWILTELNPIEPFYSLAKTYSKIFINLSEAEKEEYIVNMVKKFKIDGIIFHDAKTCPWNTNSRFGMPQRLQSKLDIPCVVINGDINDLRCYSEEQTKTNIEAFMEMLEERGGGGV